MSDDDLDELLVDLGAQLDARLNAQLVATEAVGQARQIFLQRFRDIADTNILPVFHHVAERSTAALKIRVLNSAEAAVLSITMRKDIPIAGSLGYRAELLNRRILKARRIQGRDLGQDLPAQEEELTSEQVRKEIAELLREMRACL